LKLGLPEALLLLAVQSHKGAEVCYATGSHDDVTHDALHLFAKPHDSLLPSHLLAAKATQQAIGSVHLDITVLESLGERLLLLNRGREIGIQLRQPVHQLLEPALQNAEFALDLFEFGRSCCQCYALGLHLERDVVIGVHGASPLAHCRARARHRLDF